MIQKPCYIDPDKTIGEALDIMKKYSISGIPIIDNKGKLVGILTKQRSKVRAES